MSVDKGRVYDSYLEQIGQTAKERAQAIETLDSPIVAEGMDSSHRGESSLFFKEGEESHLVTRAREQARVVSTVRGLRKQMTVEKLRVGVGALLTVKNGGPEERWYIVPSGGNANIEVDGQLVRCFSHNAPLIQEIIGSEAGDDFDTNSGSTWEIVSVN